MRSSTPACPLPFVLGQHYRSSQKRQPLPDSRAPEGVQVPGLRQSHSTRDGEQEGCDQTTLASPGTVCSRRKLLSQQAFPKPRLHSLSQLLPFPGEHKVYRTFLVGEESVVEPQHWFRTLLPWWRRWNLSHLGWVNCQPLLPHRESRRSAGSRGQDGCTWHRVDPRRPACAACSTLEHSAGHGSCSAHGRHRKQ